MNDVVVLVSVSKKQKQKNVEPFFRFVSSEVFLTVVVFGVYKKKRKEKRQWKRITK